MSQCNNCNLIFPDEDKEKIIGCNNCNMYCCGECGESCSVCNKFYCKECTLDCPSILQTKMFIRNRKGLYKKFKTIEVFHYCYECTNVTVS